MKSSTPTRKRAKLFAPMLSAKVDDVDSLPYPLLASPKIDGIRALVRGGVLLSRNLKSIPNAHTQALFSGLHMEGCDGELVVGRPYGHDVWNRSQSGVMSRTGTPDVTFHVFDHWKADGGYGQRTAELLRMSRDGRWPDNAVIVPQQKVFNAKELREYERGVIADGYEGVMVRRLAKDTPYKFGRSTLKEGLLMKLIRRSTMEGVVVGCVEQMHNDNEKTVDARGYAKRSKVKANLVPTGVLGAIKLVPHDEYMCASERNALEFEVGTGFTAEQRAALWRDRKSLKGKLVTVEYRELTPDGLPRFPVFKGFRHVNDVSA